MIRSLVKRKQTNQVELNDNPEFIDINNKMQISI
jgi:hypothetical protein